MNVAVLMGGRSAEREVSLGSGVQVVRALREAGHRASGVDTASGVLDGSQEAAILDSGVGDPVGRLDETDMLSTGDLSLLTDNPALQDIDVVFPALHGGRGEDGTLQTLLDIAGIPYVGSDRIGCALAMDKDLSKRLFRDAGIPTPDWVTLQGFDECKARSNEVVQRLGLPLIVKPPSGGSTVGLTLVEAEDELPGAIERSLGQEGRVMFEQYVAGREMTVGILGLEALAVGEIIPEHTIFDYECKYTPGMAQELFPADLPTASADQLREQALAAHRCLVMRDISRVDFILGPDGTPWCLEANALPGLTSNSLLPKAARASGISFPELCDRAVRMARERSVEDALRETGTRPELR